MRKVRNMGASLLHPFLSRLACDMPDNRKLQMSLMTVKWPQTKEEAQELLDWQAGRGPVTAVVKDAWMRTGLTFGACLITRKFSDSWRRN